MKKYALRVEHASNILSSLNQHRLTEDKLEIAYDTYVKALIGTLKKNALEEVEIELHKFDELERIKKSYLDKSVKYLCLDSQSKLGIELGVSRLFDLVTGKQIGITSRPGYPDLEEQIDRIKRTHGYEYGIIEDDIFSGGTLYFIIDLLEKQGVKINSIVAGVSSTKKIGNLDVSAGVYYRADNLLELTDPRDYLFGAANGGLVVEFKGSKFRAPYCPPLTDVVARSSIDPNKSEIFSKQIRLANLELHKTLGSLELRADRFYPKELLQHLGLETDITIGQLIR